MHKSQSAVTYAVQKIESGLAVKVFEIQGRKAVLTPSGQMLYRRALALVSEANALEWSIRTMSSGWELEIHLAVEVLFPVPLLLGCLERFGQESPFTRIELTETVLDGSSEMLTRGQADLAISPHIPAGYLGDPLINLRLIAVASPNHPLHRLGRELTYRDLRSHRQVVMRDNGTRREKDSLFFEVNNRSSIKAVRMGHGFAWFPDEIIRHELDSGALKPLPLREGGEFPTDFYLILADPDFAGSGVKRLAEILREAAKSYEQAAPA
ncbi:MAG: LysR family transcriptional regulator [Sulfuricella sp.]|nr:LysR family transcriptional regulator [Sulfuricella sp.]